MEIRILPRDTASSVFLRAAATLNSIPKYLYMKNAPILPGAVETKLGQESIIDIKTLVRSKSLQTEVVDMFKAIQSRDRGNTIQYFARFLAENVKYFPSLSLKDDIIKPWLYYHVDSGQDMDLVIFSYVDTINKALKTSVDITTMTFENDQYDKINAFSETLKTVQMQNKEIMASYVEVANLAYTPFELEQIKYALHISDNNSFTLQEIFDAIILSSEFPFAQLFVERQPEDDSYYKIYKDFVPEIGWISPQEGGSQIILKFLTDKTEKMNVAGVDVVKPVYEDIRVISYDGKCILLLDAAIDQSGEASFFEKVLRVFQRARTDVILEEPVSIKGVFYIPNQTINKYIFSHLVMNDINFSVLVIDEVVGKPTKRKTGLYMYYLTNDVQDPYATSILITPKVMDRFDPTMRGKSPTMFPENEPYIRFRVTAKTNSVIQEIQDNMGRILALYKHKLEETLMLYRSFIPDFELEKELDVKTYGKKNEKKESRRCPHPPIVIKPEEAPQYEDTMVFPLPGDPSGKPSRLYACTIGKKSELKFVGLQLRRDTGEFVPCCFQTNQKMKSGSDYNKYLTYIDTGEKMEKNSGKAQQRVIKTKKFLKYQEFSDNVVHDTIEKLFDFADPDKPHVRYGTYKSKMSMLFCMLELFREEKTLVSESDGLRVKEQLANTPRLLSLCKQALPNKSIEEIKAYLQSDVYIDPRIFTNMLEEFFDCRIYTLNSTGLIGPEYKKGFLQYQSQVKRERTVLLVEHMGAEADHSTTPQCEILAYTVDDVANYFFDSASIVAKLLHGIFKRMTRSHFLNSEVKPFQPLPFKPIGQRFDSFGKVFAFMVQGGGGVYTIYTKRPFPPLPIPEFAGAVNSFPSIFEVTRMIDGVVKNGAFESSDFIIPMGEGVHTEGVHTERVLPQSSTSLSVVREFALYSKLSKYILEYFFYGYSFYLFDNGLEIGDESISQFASTVIEDASVNYGPINKMFSQNNTIYSGGRITVPSEEIQKRCIYALKLESARHPDAIIGYKNKKNIFSFLDTINDYTQYATQNILFGKDALLKYITEFFTSQEIDYAIGFNGSLPHYYKFEGDIYLSQNILPQRKERGSLWAEPSKNTVINPKEGYRLAMNVCSNWETTGINVDTESDKCGFSVYKYSRDCADYKTEKFKLLNSGDTDQKIIGYKINGTPKYTALLNINAIKY